jgi:Flp pilus assembly protein TadB
MVEQFGQRKKRFGLLLLACLAFALYVGTWLAHWSGLIQAAMFLLFVSCVGLLLWQYKNSQEQRVKR